MTDTANQFLMSFRALSPADQHAVLLQLLREPIDAEYHPPSDEELAAVAEVLFLEYDKSEAEK